MKKEGNNERDWFIKVCDRFDDLTEDELEFWEKAAKNLRIALRLMGINSDMSTYNLFFKQAYVRNKVEMPEVHRQVFRLKG